jgi:TRAP-type C4-dicarboxylate transport system permease small subunit
MLRTIGIGLRGLSGALNRLALGGSVVGVVVMVGAAAYQVVARYLFEAPPAWTEELARYAMVWTGMLGASAAFYSHADPTLFPGMRLIRGVAGRLIGLLRMLAVLVFALPVIYFSVFGPRWDVSRGFVGRSMGRAAEMLGVPMGWFAVAIPIAFTLIVIHALAHQVDAIRGEQSVAGD